MDTTKVAIIGAFGTTVTAIANDVLSLSIGLCTLIVVAPKAYSSIRRFVQAVKFSRRSRPHE